MVVIEFIVGKPNGSVERLIAFFFPFFHGSDSYLILLWLELASEAGLFRPDIFTDHTLIARTKLIFDRKLSDDRTLSYALCSFPQITYYVNKPPKNP